MTNDLPIRVIPNETFTDEALDKAFNELEARIQWEQHDDNRIEAFFNRTGLPYQYGPGRHFRPQYYQDEPLDLFLLWSYVEAQIGCEFEFCFVNLYLNGEGTIGWHTDASPSIDPHRPVTVLALGAERPTSFRPIADPDNVKHFVAGNGGILSMTPPCNQLYEHAVLPAINCTGKRMSLVFRGAAPFAGKLLHDFQTLGVKNEAKEY